MSREPTKPSESVVQQLLAERRELRVAFERLNLELSEVRSAVGGPDPRVTDLTAEVERLKYQLAQARAEARLLRDERDELRKGVEHALDQIAKQ